MDGRDRRAGGEAGSPLPLDAHDVAGGEDLADGERAPVHLGHEQAPVVHVEHVTAGRREQAPLRLEEVAPRAGAAARNPCLREGRGMPDHLGLGEDTQPIGRREPVWLRRAALVVADTAVTVGPAVCHDTRAPQERAVATSGAAGAGRARAVRRCGRLEVDRTHLALEGALDGGDTDLHLGLVLTGTDLIEPLAAGNGLGEGGGIEEGRPHLVTRSGNVGGPLDLHPSSFRRAAAMRLMPSLIVSSPVAYESRIWASEPKSTPATVAMRASSKRKAQTSAEPLSTPPFHRLPQSPETFGKT